MNKNRLILKLDPILSSREIEVVIKRLNNRHITQTESNYLSRSVRPKLKSAEFAVSADLLSLLDYRRKKYERENQILRKKIIGAVQKSINNFRNIRAIIVFGSYIRNRHTNYKDIDVMIVLNRKTWKSQVEKHGLEADIEKNIEIKADIKTDINLTAYSELTSLFPYSPLLQTELENHKVIYGDTEKINRGKIKSGKKIIINKAYLYKKLLETEYILEAGKGIEPKYIYNAIRTCLSIKLFLKKTVSNRLIINTIKNNIGQLTADSLINNKANSIQKDIALRYLKYLYNKLEKILKKESVSKNDGRHQFARLYQKQHQRS